MISKFVPEFAGQGIIDHDYTVLAMRRYAESCKQYWSRIITKVKNQHVAVIESLNHFQKNELKKYKETRRNFDITQSRYDNTLSKYAGYSKNKEPSSLREDAFQLAECRKDYIKASFELSTVIATTQFRLDTCLVKTLAEPWILSPKEFSSAEPSAQRIGIEMLRLRAWTKAIHKNSKPLLKEMEKVSKELEDKVIEGAIPSRDIGLYTAKNSTITHFVPNKVDENDGSSLGQKNGWLFVKSTSNKGVRQIWVRRWVFVKNGMFGWLNISPSGTFVQECDKIGVLLCHVTPVPNEERRFVFEIKTKDTVLLMQAETIEDLRSWLQVFEDAKRLAIEGDKKSNISRAFQRFPPLISEFASTAGTSIDVELTHSPAADDEIESAGLVHSISLFKGIEEAHMKSFMPLNDESPLSDSEQPKAGLFGSALAPSPLLNIPIPTSLSQEAILSTSLVDDSDIPTAVTANFWGTVNWATYKNDDTEQETNDLVPVDSTSSDTSMVQLKLDKYPSYYPPLLRSQDAQVHALFSSLPEDNDNDRVVLVFKCLLQANPTQLLPARLYITPSHAYIYCNFLGMVTTVVSKIADMVSVEGKTGLSQDVLYLIGEKNVSTCYFYLDSGKILQRRLQFLIDNARAENPLTLKEMIETLQDIGEASKKNAEAEETDEEIVDADALVTHDMKEATALSGKKYMYNYIRSYYNVGTNSKKSERTKSDIPNLSNTPIDAPDFSKLMTKLSKEHIFDIPAKALFHLMFGEKSSVFKYTNAGSLERKNIEIKPWMLVDSQRIEREIHFKISEKHSGYDNGLETIMFFQRVEKIDNNNCYIVFERQTIVQLPQGDNFLTTHRFVITRVDKNSSKLSIWSGIDWINATIMKGVTEPMVLKRMEEEAVAIIDQCNKFRVLMGSKGSSVTAIRIFGKVGTSGKSIGETNIDSSTISDDNTTTEVFKVTHRSYFNGLKEVAGSSAMSAIESFILLIKKLVEVLWDGIFSNQILIIALVISCTFNLILTSKTTLNFLTYKEGNAAINDSSHTYNNLVTKSILLKDIDALIQNGSRFSIEAQMAENLQSESTSSCYNKFKSLVLVPDSPEDYIQIERNIKDQNSMEGTQPYDIYLRNVLAQEPPDSIRSRIYNIRSSMGIKRNSLIIELRTVNRLESDLVMKEWRSWLIDESRYCSKVLNVLGSKASSNTENTDMLAELVRSAPIESQELVLKYCQSCAIESSNFVDIELEI